MESITDSIESPHSQISAQKVISTSSLALAHISASPFRLENETTKEYSNVEAFANSIDEAEKQLAKFKAAQLQQKVQYTSTSGTDDAKMTTSTFDRSELFITIPPSLIGSETTSLAESTESAKEAIKKPSLRKRIWKGMKKLFCCC